jgi:Fe-S cluster assembly protein SufD
MSIVLTPMEEAITLEPTDLWLSNPPVTDSDAATPIWYREIQEKSWERFKELPVPTRTNQHWRFADLKMIRFADLAPAVPASDPASLVARAKANRPADFAAHFVFANNRLIHSEIVDLPGGAICLPLNEALATHGDLLRGHFLQETQTLGGDKFAALHGAATLGGLFVHFPKGCISDKPVLVHHFSGGESQLTFPHTLVIAEDNAAVSVVDVFESIAASEQTLTIGLVDLIADRGGKIQYVSLQNLSENGAKHVQINNTRAGRDASVKVGFINLGAAWVRNESLNRMTDNGADCQIFSANLANGIQEYDQRTLQSHEAQHTTSDLFFKNALYNKSRTIFSGLIHVKPGAHHTDSFQTCRNLLGSEEAEANSMPGLEIDADQVKCSHGSTSGQISDEEIFYLQARGIPADDARKIISLGFLNESIEKLEGDELKGYLFSAVERKFTHLDESA